MRAFTSHRTKPKIKCCFPIKLFLNLINQTIAATCLTMNKKLVYSLVLSGAIRYLLSISKYAKSIENRPEIS